MRLRNRITGLVHEVPAGHPAIGDAFHEVVVDPPVVIPPAPEAEAEAEEPKPAPKRRGRPPKAR